MKKGRKKGVKVCEREGAGAGGAGVRGHGKFNQTLRGSTFPRSVSFITHEPRARAGQVYEDMDRPTNSTFFDEGNEVPRPEHVPIHVPNPAAGPRSRP